VIGQGSVPGSSPDIILEGRFSPSDRMRYVLVPFEIPRGVGQLEIRYSYTERIDSDPLLGGGNTLDIGLFDPRGTDAGSVGFRGWSGSHQDVFVVGEAWATPPYAAGPIIPGTWNVLLGPYKVAPDGCSFRVEIRLDPGVQRLPHDLVRSGQPGRPVLPVAKAGWLRGDLHCHTRYSDGDSWPSEMLHAAVEAGLEFLGVTDHNNVAHHAEYGPGGGPVPIVIPGVEVTTYGGHWNAWGTAAWWEFREPTGPAVERATRAAADAGAFVSVNHPKPFGPAWEYDTIGAAHAIEVWNGPWTGRNSIAVAFWETRLRAGQRLTAVGGSDTHRLRSPDTDSRHSPGLGRPTTWVEAGPRPDAAAILRGMRAGRTFVSASPHGPQLYLDRVEAKLTVDIRGGRGMALLLIGERGVIEAQPVESDEATTTVDVPGRTSYVRAQLVDASGEVAALTSPIWLS
jgi:hypothetical protein